MLIDPQLYFFFTLMGVAFYWCAPRHRPVLRGSILIVVSCLFIWLLSYQALGLCLALSLTVYVTGRLTGRFGDGRALRVGIPAVAILMVAAGLIWPKDRDAMITLGLSFMALKSVAAMVDGYLARAKAPPLSFGHILLLNAFFPIFTAGPIERSEAFARDRLAVRFDPEDFISGLVRIAIGFFKISFVSGLLLKGFVSARYPGVFSAQADYSAAETLAFLWLNFLSLYLNFSGYTDVAVGTGRLFGLRIRENFRLPILARNIQNFWQRWHLSLADFVFRYLFVNLARATRGRVELSIVLSFVIVGLWHDLSVNYLVWGLCHGLGLVAVAKYKKVAGRFAWWSRLRRTPIHAAAAWFLTITLVAWLSAFANAGSLDRALVLTGRLVGF